MYFFRLITALGPFSAGLILFFSSSVFAQKLIEQIGWKGADYKVLSGILLALFSGFGVLIVLHVKTKARESEDKTQLSKRLYREYAEKAELNSEERLRLQSLIRYASTPHEHIIFQSAVLFEKCIDQEIRRLLQENLSAEQLDDEEMVFSGLRKKLGYGYLPLEHPLISTRNLELGQRLSIFGQNNQVPLIHDARIVQVREFTFRVQYNPEAEETILLEKGQAVRLAFARQNDGVYGVPVTIHRRDTAALDFLHSMDLRRNQLRQFVRIEANLPLKFRITKTESEESKQLFGTLLQSKIADISGGGLSFLLDKPLVPGDLVSLNFQLSTSAFVGVAGRVLRVSLQEGKTAVFYKHHVQFLNIEHKSRERIVKYVFEKQRQLSQWR